VPNRNVGEFFILNIRRREMMRVVFGGLSTAAAGFKEAVCILYEELDEAINLKKMTPNVFVEDTNCFRLEPDGKLVRDTLRVRIELEGNETWAEQQKVLAAVAKFVVCLGVEVFDFVFVLLPWALRSGNVQIGPVLKPMVDWHLTMFIQVLTALNDNSPLVLKLTEDKYEELWRSGWEAFVASIPEEWRDRVLLDHGLVTGPAGASAPAIWVKRA
jgi:hypothetical protein